MKNEQDAVIIPDQEPEAQPQDAVIEADQALAADVDQAEAEIAAAFPYGAPDVRDFDSKGAPVTDVLDSSDADLPRQREQLRQSGYSAAEKEQ